ncbi:MAG: hypothetical protein EON52_28285, partial [Actinomycetales bacterium]
MSTMTELNRTTMHRRRAQYATALLVCATVLLAGCSGDDGNDDAKNRKSEVIVNVDPAEEAALMVPERRFFRDDSPWNQRIDSVNADPNSDRMIELAQERIGVIEGPNGTLDQTRDLVDDGVYINTTRWTVPVVAGGRPTQLVCRQLVCGDGADTTTLNIPDDVDPDPRYDGWYTVFDTSASVAYDLWRARREDENTISYNYMRKWDLNGPGYSPPWTEGARGSGL